MQLQWLERVVPNLSEIEFEGLRKLLGRVAGKKSLCSIGMGRFLARSLLSARVRLGLGMKHVPYHGWVRERW